MAAALFTVLWYFAPPSRFQVCGFHWLTGRPCPLCGMTRAMFALAKGHFSEAVHLNALAPLGFAMVFALFWSEKVSGKIWSIGVGSFAMYGLLRIFVTQ